MKISVIFTVSVNQVIKYFGESISKKYLLQENFFLLIVGQLRKLINGSIVIITDDINIFANMSKLMNRFNINIVDINHKNGFVFDKINKSKYILFMDILSCFLRLETLDFLLSKLEDKLFAISV